MTTFRWYLLGILLLFGGYVALEYYRPKPLDWSPTLRNTDKIPYGTYVVYDALPQVLGTDSVAGVRLPIYNQLLGTEEPDLRRGRPSNVTFADDSEAETESDSASEAAADSMAVDTAATEAQPAAANDQAAAETETQALPLVATRANYLFINRSFDASRLETAALLRFVAAGHDVFIAAERFASYAPGTLADTLGVRLYETAGRHPLVPRVGPAAAPDSVQLHLLRARPGLAATRFRFGAGVAGYRLALAARRPHHGATLAADERGRPVLLRLDHGRGHFYLCSVPLAFGNYWVLRARTADFAFAALSYLPAGPPCLVGRVPEAGPRRRAVGAARGAGAPRPAGRLLPAAGRGRAVCGRGRRGAASALSLPCGRCPTPRCCSRAPWQASTSRGRNHAPIAEKKVALFLDYLRTRFQEPAPDLADEAFRERLSQKAGLPRPRIDELVRLINFARTAPAVTDRDLLILSRAIRDFKQEVQR